MTPSYFISIPPGLINSKLSHPILREVNAIEVTAPVAPKPFNEFLWGCRKFKRQSGVLERGKNRSVRNGGIYTALHFPAVFLAQLCVSCGMGELADFVWVPVRKRMGMFKVSS